MVICATLTSLRRFFKHIAPRFIGERSSGSNSNSRPQENSELVTFGGSNKKYKKFSQNQHLRGENTDVTIIEEPAVREDLRSSGDGNSQRGILQTHITSVTYEPRNGVE